MNAAKKQINIISIHAPLTGSDVDRRNRQERDQRISIHAPLTGSDPSSASQRPPATYFNPRSPYGERPILAYELEDKVQFQSTLPLRGATFNTS